MIVFVYGYEGSGAGHWQRWAAAALAARDVPVAFPELSEPTAPRKDVWVAELRAVVEAAARRSDPVTFVCHSLGCWAVDHYLTEHGTAGVHAALLVAPPSPFLVFEPVDSFLPPPRDPAVWAPIALRTLLIGSDNDDYASPDEIEQIAHRLGIPHQILPNAGHINIDAGYGPWPFALDWLYRIAGC